MKLMEISQVASQTGVAASTLRYYEEKGLIESLGRRGLRRLFHPDVVLRLNLISLGKSAGFTLDEIAEILKGTGAPELPREELHRRADELDQQIRRLGALRDTLRHVAECPAPKHLECPTFRRLVTLGGLHRKRAYDRAGGKMAKPR